FSKPHPAYFLRPPPARGPPPPVPTAPPACRASLRILRRARRSTTPARAEFAATGARPPRVSCYSRTTKMPPCWQPSDRHVWHLSYEENASRRSPPAGKGGALYAAICAASTKRYAPENCACRRDVILQAVAHLDHELVGVPHVGHVAEQLPAAALVIAQQIEAAARIHEKQLRQRADLVAVTDLQPEVVHGERRNRVGRDEQVAG